MADLLDALRNHKGAESSGDWIIGNGYDGSLLVDKRFPTREELDTVSSDRPVLVLHVSGRSGSCNSACLSLAGYSAATFDPNGGIIRRKERSREPNGVLEGTALTAVLAKVPRPSDEVALAALEAVLARYAARGVTTVQDEAEAPSDSALVANAASRRSLPIDVVTYVEPEMAKSGNAAYQNRLRQGGVHISLDGAVQQRAAWMSQPYLVTADGPKVSYSGRPVIMDTELVAPLEKAKQDGAQVLAHCHGDLAVEQFLRLSERVLGSDPGDRRWVLSAQTLREDQLDRAKKLPLMTAFFASQVYYWGDLHRDAFLGPQRAENVSPAHWALEKEMRFTLFDDPVLARPDPLLLLWSSTNRLTHTDQLLGPDQRISVYHALEALTVEGAYQLFEEKEKGTLEPNKRADLVILAANPFTEPLTSLRTIEVVETVKDGVTIWPR
jgi:predicted amidohydrolase YtcJ